MKKLFFTFILFITCIFLSGFSVEASEIVDTSNHIYTFSEMEADISELAALYPDALTCFTLGTSVDNRQIWDVTVGNINAPKAIYVQAGLHGREWMNTWLVMKQIETICQNWETEVTPGIRYKDYFQNICLCIVPMVNPDGVTISQYGIDGINDATLRANLKKMPGASKPRYWKANANGVDLNRNFSVGWGKMTTTGKPGSTGYGGTASMTEPEIQAICNAMALRSYTIAITYHSTEGAIYWNLGQSGELYDKTYALANQVSSITGYKLGAKSEVHGLEYNWFIFDQNIPTVLIETGTVPCPLPYSQWAELWKRNCNLLFQLITLYV